MYVLSMRFAQWIKYIITSQVSNHPMGSFVSSPSFIHSAVCCVLSSDPFCLYLQMFHLCFREAVILVCISSRRNALLLADLLCKIDLIINQSKKIVLDLRF